MKTAEKPVIGPRLYAFALDNEIFTLLPVTSGHQRLWSASQIFRVLHAVKEDLEQSPASAKMRDRVMLTLRSLLRAYPTDQYLWHFAGKWAEERGFKAEALALYQRGLQYVPDDEHLLRSASLIAHRLGRGADASKSIHRLLEKQQDNFRTLGLATQIELAAGNIPAARGYVQKLPLDGSDPVALVLATQVELASGKPDAARGYVQKLPLDGSNAAALGLATQVELAVGNIPAAREYIGRRLAVSTDSAALVLATQVELAAGNIPAAREYIGRRLAVSADSAALGLATQVELAAGKPDAALALIDRFSVPGKDAGKIFSYLKAKAFLFKGEIGSVLGIVAPLIRDYPDPAFTTLYMACQENADDVGMLRPLLGDYQFDRMWANSRDLKAKTGEIGMTEQALFYGHSFWDSAATYAVSRAGVLQMAEVPGPMRRKLEGYHL